MAKTIRASNMVDLPPWLVDSVLKARKRRRSTARRVRRWLNLRQSRHSSHDAYMLARHA